MSLERSRPPRSSRTLCSNMPSHIVPVWGRAPLATPSPTWVTQQLRQRVHLPATGPATRTDGTHVVCWIQSTRRLRDNWTVLAAQRAAAKLGRPLVVYQGLDATYPYATPRSHEALLRGMAALRVEAAALGVSLVQPVVRPGTLAHGLIDALAATACCVITDVHPTAGIGARTDRVAARLAAQQIPLWRVESLSLTPAQSLVSGGRPGGTHLHRKRFTTTEVWHDLVEVPWEEVSPWPEEAAWSAMLAARHRVRASPANARASWAGDESPRVPAHGWNTPEGLAQLLDSTRPLLQRHEVTPLPTAVITAQEAQDALQQFVRTQGLANYAAGAMDPAAPASHSGLSAALHFGHVSPGQLLRQLCADGVLDLTQPPEALAPGPRRWLDQIWTRRDVALHWADAVRDVTRPELVPPWAQQTLEAHQGDRDADPQDPGDAALEAATTGDALWDATMRELRTTGRIHPYARMIWGKMILQWAPDWRTAHARLFRLNDTWAIDGRDAISALSLLWVFGLGDQPFPERPRWGIVRPMLTRSSGKKFKAAAYIARQAVLAPPLTPGASPVPPSP